LYKGLITTKDIEYRPYRWIGLKEPTQSVQVLGLDTESYQDGRCFMIATSLGDVFQLDMFPACLFSRKYRNKVFVAYNLKYDEGSLLQVLPRENLKELWETGKTLWQGYTFWSIPRKMLKVSRGRNSITIYDLANFFQISLDKAANLFLSKSKLEMDTNLFTPRYVAENWIKIAEYCIQDAILVKELADCLIAKFESFGVKPQKLFSTAYVSWQYFSSKCRIPNIRRYWLFYRECLDYAMLAYAGGKFEVTEKGYDYYYEYDINSAYPHEIANLLDISDAVVWKSSRYERTATYGFIQCKLSIPPDLFHPVPLKRETVNVFPAGNFVKFITKAEYDYLKSRGARIEIIDAWWLRCKREVYPFREEVNRLYALKTQLKREGKIIDYHIVKILLNSLYGKFLQLVREGGKWKAGASWNVIYGAIITANVRIRVSEMQNRYPQVVAVHTDSIIAKEPLPIPTNGQLGEWTKEVEGEGIILGSGIYQIDGKTKFRGFDTRLDLMELVKTRRKKITLKTRRPFSWREVVFHNWDPELINRFEEIPRELRLDFDIKRLWIDDWERFNEVLDRKVESISLWVTPLLDFELIPTACERCGKVSQDYEVQAEADGGGGSLIVICSRCLSVACRVGRPSQPSR